MTIQKMHELFRDLGQTMGYQNVRGILPEQIDDCLNSCIISTVNTIYLNHSNKSSDIGHRKTNNVLVNSLRTLYSEFSIMCGTLSGFAFPENGTIDIDEEMLQMTFSTGGVSDSPNVLFYVDFDMLEIAGEIYKANGIYNINRINEDVKRMYPIRFIDSDALGETLNDYILKPTCESPVLVMYSNPDVKTNNNLDVIFKLYLGKLKRRSEHSLVLPNNRVPDRVKIGYIKKPAIVSISTNTDCDLPEHLHDTIVKSAVLLYQQAIKGINGQKQQAASNAATE